MKILLLFTSLFASVVQACPVKEMPDKDFDVYETIFIGQVTGVRLTEYQNQMLEGLKEDPNYSLWSDTTFKHEVTVLPQLPRKGQPAQVEVLNVSGCGVIVPNVRSVGLFFIKPDGKVHVLYNQESYLYEEYVGLVWEYMRNNRIKPRIDRGK